MNNNNNDIRFEDLVGIPKNNNNGNGNGDSYGVFSMVFGILSLIVVCCAPMKLYIAACSFSIALAITAIILNVVSKSKGSASGKATAGLVCGIIGLCFSVSLIMAMPSLMPLYEQYMAAIESSLY